jgi:uncharacterized protein (TIGR02598 family)
VKSNPDRHNGFSLVEVTLALGIAAISLMAIFALLPVGLQTNQNAIEQTASSGIMSAVVADLRATPPTVPRGSSATSAQFGINIPENPVNSSTSSTLYFDGDGRSSTSLSSNSRYRLIVTFVPNGSSSRTATFIDLKMTWPAAASPANATGSAQTFVALDRN